MFALVDILVVAGAYVTAYIVSLYSLAVYIDPEEVEVLFPNISAARRKFLLRLSRDPRAFVQIATAYRSLSLVAISVCTYHFLASQHMPPSWPAWLPPVVGLLLAWIIFIMLVEFLPRRSSRGAISRHMARHLWFISIVYFVFYPLVRCFRSLLSRVPSDDQITEEAKEEIVERAIETLADQAGIDETLVEEEEKEMIGQIFQLDQTVVREIMIPRIRITGIEKNMSFKDIKALVLRDGHSRYPVYDQTIDSVIGLIYVKDLFNKLPEPGEEFVLTNYLRDAYFVPETKVIGDLLREFKLRRQHIAIVVDDYGGVAGVVTLEDIIEEIFGEIQDEHDTEPAEFSVLPDGSYSVSAHLLVEDLQERLGTDFEQGDYDTVGGLIYNEVGSVPREGQIIKWFDLEFQVTGVEGQRIERLTVRKA